MRLLDISFASPAENLALDEVILDSAETGRVGETLRFWESPVPFVVLGVSQVLCEEVHEDACAADGVPILRRCSAGGCVLQGPGCLNFSLALTHEGHPQVRALRASYCYILNAICGALKGLGAQAAHNGISDIVVGGQKVSGNAQKRRKHAILHHGTLLYGMTAEGMSRYLREPADRPEYRGERDHREFVRCLPFDATVLREAIRAAFGVNASIQGPSPTEIDQMTALAAERYATEAWTRRR